MNSINCDKWDLRFLDLAALIAEWSKDESTKVGSVITKGNNIVSLGYNGFPYKIKDDQRLKNREEKYKIIIHAEANSILFANQDLEGCTIYTYPFMPCSSCASLIIQSGITRVVSYNIKPERWCENFKISENLFKEAEVKLFLYPFNVK
jgi:dCMP deaminase